MTSEIPLTIQYRPDFWSNPLPMDTKLRAGDLVKVNFTSGWYLVHSIANGSFFYVMTEQTRRRNGRYHKQRTLAHVAKSCVTEIRRKKDAA